VRVVTHEGGIRDGAQVPLRVGPKPFALRWDLEHRDYQPGRSFTDLQLAGPFRYWKHVHRMVPLGPQARSSKTRSSTNCRSVRSDGWSTGSSRREN
jgi:ligand-binding SRPBCC domain-containing protein